MSTVVICVTRFVGCFVLYHIIAHAVLFVFLYESYLQTCTVLPRYPSVRDAKAAVRWVRANQAELGVDASYITANGGSAGACSVVGLATTFEVG